MYEEFIVVDPAASERSSSNFSVVFWFVEDKGILYLRGSWHGHVNLYDLGKTICLLACTDGFTNHIIANVCVEGESNSAAIRQNLVDQARRISWKVEGIPISNVKDAKCARIGRAIEAVNAGLVVMQFLPNPNLVQFDDETARRLKEQLDGENYRDADGRDDFADCLGLAVEKAFGAFGSLSAPKPQAVDSLPSWKRYEQPLDDTGGGGLCTG